MPTAKSSANRATTDAHRFLGVCALFDIRAFPFAAGEASGTPGFPALLLRACLLEKPDDFGANRIIGFYKHP
jgi:hypothetical protein